MDIGRIIVKTKIVLTTVTVIVLVFGSFFVTGGFYSSANEVYNLEEAVKKGYVIQHQNQILNLIRFQQFFENVERGINDSITVISHPATRNHEEYELHYQDGSLLVYYDMTQNPQGRREYKIKQYDSLIRTLKGNEIQFYLVSETQETHLLYYSLVN